MYLLFFQSILPLFTSLNKVLQSDEPKRHVMLEMINVFLRQLLGRSVKPEVLGCNDLGQVNVDNPDHWLHHSEVMLGFLTHSTMTSQNILPGEKKHVSENCRHYMVEAFKYAVSHLPIHDEVLKHAEVVRFDHVRVLIFNQYHFFVQCFCPLRDKMTDYMDKLFYQFTEYRSLPESLSVEHDRIDHMWHCLGNLQGCTAMRMKKEFSRWLQRIEQNLELVCQIRHCPQY